MCWNPPIKEKTMEEIKRRNRKSTINIRSKSNDFARLFIRSIMTKGRTPLNNWPQLEKTFFYEWREVRFGTLTGQPPIVQCGGGDCSILLLPLDGSLGSNTKIHLVLRAHTLGGLRFCEQRRRNGSQRRRSGSKMSSRTDLTLVEEDCKNANGGQSSW